jgi:long-chain fatty acid transport protein
VGKGGIIDDGVSYLLLKNSQIDNNQLVDGRGRITGEYSANAWIFGLQYSRAF